MRLSIFLCAALALFATPAIAQPTADYEVQKRRALELLRQTKPFIRPPGAVVAPPPKNQIDVTLPPIPVGPARELALLVGVDRYQAVKPLRGCANDVRRMSGLLIAKFGFKRENVITLTDEQATRTNILAYFQRHLIDRAQPDSVVVFHFSGHGSQTFLDPFGGDETILPVDSRTPNVYDISAPEMRQLIVKVEQKTKQVTFLLDCCRGMTIPRATGPIVPLVRFVESDPRISKTPALGLTNFKSSARTAPERFDPQGFTSVAGCSPTEFSFETNDPNTNEPCGAFTNLFIREVQRSSGSVPTWKDMMLELKRGLTALNFSQTPEVEMGLADRVIFSGTQPIQRASFVVEPHAEGARFFGGSVQGLMVGSQWEVYSPTATDFPRDRGIALIEIVNVTPFSATAKLIRGAPVPLGGRAVPRRLNYYTRRAGVFLTDLDGTARARLQQAIDSAPATGGGAQSVETQPFQVVSRIEDARYIIQGMTPAMFNALDQRRQAFERLNESGPNLAVLTSIDGIALAQPIGVDDPRLSTYMVERLTNSRRAWQVQNAMNAVPSTIAFDFKISGPSGAVVDDAMPLAVASGSIVKVSVKNNGNMPLYFGVIMSSDEGMVSFVDFRQQPGAAVAPGSAVEGDFQLAVPSGRRRSRATFKLIATTKQTDFGILAPARWNESAAAGSSPADLFREAMQHVRAGMRIAVDADDWVTDVRSVDLKKDGP